MFEINGDPQTQKMANVSSGRHNYKGLQSSVILREPVPKAFRISSCHIG